jgi:hypothetical protein
MASKDPKVSKQGTADKRTHVTLMIPQKLEIIRRLETDKSQSVVNIGWLTIYAIKKHKDPITILYGIKCKCEGPLQATDIETV